MTPQPQASYAVNCPVCSRCLQVGNPRPREVPARILFDEFEWPDYSPRICHKSWIECTDCGCQLYVLLLYASEEVIQELNINQVPWY